MSTNVLSNVGLILNVCESSPKNTKVTWAKTGALPWQIHRLPGRSSEMSRNRLNGGNARCSPSSKPHPPSLSFLLIIVVVVVVVVAPPPFPLSISTPPGEGATSEPEKKTILMGHKISSFYAPSTQVFSHLFYFDRIKFL